MDAMGHGPTSRSTEANDHCGSTPAVGGGLLNVSACIDCKIQPTLGDEGAAQLISSPAALSRMTDGGASRAASPIAPELLTRWRRKPDSNHRYRVTPTRFREGSSRLCLLPASGKSRRQRNRLEDNAGRLSRDRRLNPVRSSGESGANLGGSLPPRSFTLIGFARANDDRAVFTG
jgi:hypothetical protein